MAYPLSGPNGRDLELREYATRHRYDKLAVRYEATIHIAAINEWLPNF